MIRSHFFKFHYALILLGFSLLIGCSTPRKQSFEKIQVGLDKSDVLELVGNPNHKARVHNQDRWTYDWIDEKSQEPNKTVVFFSEGRVTFVDPKGTFGQSTGSQPPAKSTAPKSTEKNFVPVGE